MPTMFHARLAGGGAVALLLVAAGCGGSSPTAAPSGTPAHAVASTTAATRGARTVDMSLKLVFAATGPLAKAFNETDTADGAADFSTGDSMLTFHGPGTAAGGSPVTILGSAGGLYLDGAAVGTRSAAFVPYRGQELQSDPTATGSSTSFTLDTGQLGGFLPPALLASLAHTAAVARTGSATVDGTAVTGYSSAYTNLASSPFGDLRGISGPVPAVPDPTLHLWLDGHGRLVRLSSTVDLSSIIDAIHGAAPHSPGEARSTLTVTAVATMTRFGAPVDIPAVPVTPPTADTTSTTLPTAVPVSTAPSG